MMATKTKPKKTKVEPLLDNAVELDNLGRPPSADDLKELFQSPREGSSDSDNGVTSSMGYAHTETTNLDDVMSGASVQNTPQHAASREDGTSSRSSTPSSAAGMMKRLGARKNVVTPIMSERIDEVNDSVDKLPLISGGKTWSESESSTESRPGTAPVKGRNTTHDTPRPMSAPHKSPRLNRVGIAPVVAGSRDGMTTPVDAKKTSLFEATGSVNSARSTPAEAKNLTWDGEFDMAKPTAPTPKEDTIGSTGSIKTAWTAPPEPAAESPVIDQGRYNKLKEEGSQISIADAGERSKSTELVEAPEAVVAPLHTVGEHHAYIPMEYAKECIQKVIEDMKVMKANHFNIIKEIQAQYELIEKESQAQFNSHVIKMRGEYNSKVSTFRTVIEAHVTDFKDKQSFYEQAIKSLRDKNRSMLVEKKNYLTKMKEKNAWFEQEKYRISSDLTGMLDKKHSEYVLLLGDLRTVEGENKTQAERIIELEKRVEELEKDAEKNSGESSNKIKELEEKLAEMTTKLEESEKRDKEKDEKIAEHEKTIEELKQELEELKNRPQVDRATSSTSLQPIVEATTSTTGVVEVAEQQTSSTGLTEEDEEVATSMTGIIPIQVSSVSSEEVEALKARIRELEEGRDSPASVNSDAAAEEIEDLKSRIRSLEEDVTRVNDAKDTIEKEMKEEKQKMFEEAQEARQEKNQLNLALLESQNKVKILTQRLEATLSNVMDTVDQAETQAKLSAANEGKEALQGEVEELNAAVEQWKEEFRQANGRDPTEEDHTEEIQGGLEELKAKEESLAVIEKDVVVINMLLDGALPDDMAQDADSAVVVPSIADELNRQFEEERESYKQQIKQLQEDIEGLNDKVEEQKRNAENIKEERDSLEEEVSELKDRKRDLEERIEELQNRPPVERIVTVAAPVVAGEPSEEGEEQPEAVEGEAQVTVVAEATVSQQAYLDLQARLTATEAENTKEVDGLRSKVKKLESKNRHLKADKQTVDQNLLDAESKAKVARETHEAELKQKQEELDALRKELDALNEARMANVPVDTKAEMQTLNEKIRELEQSISTTNTELSGLKIEHTEAKTQVETQAVTIDTLRKQETKHEGEISKLKEHYEKKVKDLKKKAAGASPKKSPPGSASADTAKVKELEKEIAELRRQLDAASLGDKAATFRDTAKKEPAGKKDDGKAAANAAKLEKQNAQLKEQVASLKKAALDDANKIKDIQAQMKEAKGKTDPKEAQKQKKAMDDLNKKLETETKRTAKLKKDLDDTSTELEELKKSYAQLETDLKNSKQEVSKLGVAAQEGLAAMEKVTELTSSNKKLTEEARLANENYNSERILRKKYYNMVEDMKGKIRVYARCRPLSRSELERGNYSIINSPDEYSLIVQTARGPKDFQYDAVFTSEHDQVKVFEDTNNLVQSAVDGYNVCIFAYGQTGSGKTFTMIGDNPNHMAEQKFPGIAPRAFSRIYELIDENKSKFSFTTHMYMVELYLDKLIDLFGPKGVEAKLDVKKDKKGMVVVQGAVVKEAKSAEELMALFDVGGAQRHVSATKMNAESSRSHLVVAVIIEATNLSNGTVVKGKLSLVDLAGSERAAKTDANAEQLKEAQAINKSLSALGDVISALSSEQSFIPYRNNKLTTLMQDSLGGNAKTLMFVNISPADYNSDETITSLTYASRVKLITNDANKNADNKEIARLKKVIEKLKKGEDVEEEEVE